jgi:methylmalonyl-CoA/ethylmalonyl-CoA epimerase
MRIRRIEHLAIAVNDIDEALGFFRDILQLEVSHTDIEEGQRVVVAFMPVADSEIELIEPVDDDSGVARFLQQRGPGIHHICLEVDDLDAAMERLREHDVQLVDKNPYVGSSGRRLAFVHPKAAHGVLIELYEAQPGDRRIPRVQNIDELRRNLVNRSRIAAAGTRGFFAGLWSDGETDD